MKKQKNEEETAKAILDYRKKLIAEDGNFRREWNKIDVADKRQAEMAKFAAEKERIDKVKALQEQAKERLKANFNGQDFMNAQDPEKVRKQLQENRAQAAGQAEADKNRDLYWKWQEAGEGSNDARRKYTKNVTDAMNKARRGAANDFENGNVDQGELSKAQADVGKQTLETMQNQGQITGLQGQAIAENVQAIAMIQQQQQQAALISQVLAAARGQKNMAKQQGNQVQAQNGGLL